MFKLQTDKNFRVILERFLKVSDITADVNDFNHARCDTCILRSCDDVPGKFFPDSQYLIINSDDTLLLNRIKDIKSKIITCGLSTRSTVTLSSISDRKYVMCFQRSVISLTGIKISPFEFPFEICGKFLDDVSILMLYTAALLCGADISLLNKIYL